MLFQTTIAALLLASISTGADGAQSVRTVTCAGLPDGLSIDLRAAGALVAGEGAPYQAGMEQIDGGWIARQASSAGWLDAQVESTARIDGGVVIAHVLRPGERYSWASVVSPTLTQADLDTCMRLAEVRIGDPFTATSLQRLVTATELHAQMTVAVGKRMDPKAHSVGITLSPEPKSE